MRGLSRRRIVVPVGAVTLLVALLFVLLPSASGQPSGSTARQCFKPTAVPGVRRYSVPEPPFTSYSHKLPPRLAKGARREVRRSQVLRKLLHGAWFRIAAEGVWTNRAESHLLGAALFLRLAKPTDLLGGWPYDRVYNKRGRDHYVVRKVRLAEDGVSQLMVNVDAQATAVVEIMAANGTSGNCP